MPRLFLRHDGDPLGHLVAEDLILSLQVLPLADETLGCTSQQKNERLKGGLHGVIVRLQAGSVTYLGR